MALPKGITASRLATGWFGEIVGEGSLGTHTRAFHNTPGTEPFTIRAASVVVAT